MSAQEYLLKKGFKKIHQPKKRYSITIEELILMLEEFSLKKNNIQSLEDNNIQQLRLWT